MQAECSISVHTIESSQIIIFRSSWLQETWSPRKTPRSQQKQGQPKRSIKHRYRTSSMWHTKHQWQSQKYYFIYNYLFTVIIIFYNYYFSNSADDCILFKTVYDRKVSNSHQHVQYPWRAKWEAEISLSSQALESSVGCGQNQKTKTEPAGGRWAAAAQLALPSLDNSLWIWYFPLPVYLPVPALRNS